MSRQNNWVDVASDLAKKNTWRQSARNSLDTTWFGVPVLALPSSSQDHDGILQLSRRNQNAMAF